MHTLTRWIFPLLCAAACANARHPAGDVEDGRVDESQVGDASASASDAQTDDGATEADATTSNARDPAITSGHDASTVGEFSDAGKSSDAGSLRGDASTPDGGLCLPNQELEWSRFDVDNVDILLMIDNSSTLAEEQKKLSLVLPNLVAALTTGNRNGQPPPMGFATDFAPVQSLHLGVVTSDMGVNGAVPVDGCGARSFPPTAHDPRVSAQRLDKPVGDDAILQVDPAVAVDGIWVSSPASGGVLQVVPGDPSCTNVSFPPGQRFVEFTAGGDIAAAAHQFSCLAKRGGNGCEFEQQLEAVLKALTPADATTKFTGLSPSGHGTASAQGAPASANQNFLRDDSVLAIVVLSDEEDCSSPDSSHALFESSATENSGAIDVRCGLTANQSLLYPISRYMSGLRALKSAPHSERMIFAAAVGIPTAPNTGAFVHSGAATFDALLARPDMQFMVRRNMADSADEPVATCVSEGGDGSAAPGRRYLELAKSFGDNSVITSICEDQYSLLLQALIDKVSAQRSGVCLPRRLRRDGSGLVPCELLELASDPPQFERCSGPGRVAKRSRTIRGVELAACSLQQLPPGDAHSGWYYDDSSRASELCGSRGAGPQVVFKGELSLDPNRSALLLECGACD